VTLRIAFDLDGVLADMAGALDREAVAEFGSVGEESESAASTHGKSDARNVSKAPVLRRLHTQLTADQQRRLWERVTRSDNFWESLDETESGAVARLWTTGQVHRWEIIFLTTRPETAGRSAQLQSQYWLRGKGFLLPSVFVVRGSRGKIAAALELDIVVDDRPENCVDVIADSKAQAILIAFEPAMQITQNARRLGITVAHSVTQCLDLIAVAKRR
jgi:hypothetical protein